MPKIYLDEMLDAEKLPTDEKLGLKRNIERLKFRTGFGSYAPKRKVGSGEFELVKK